MNYLLVDKAQLEEKKLFPYAEQLPDGRCILPMKALKTVSGLKNVEIADADEVRRLKSLSPVLPEQDNSNPDAISNENNESSEDANLDYNQELESNNNDSGEIQTEIQTETELNIEDDATDIE